ncbi:MAG: AIPR family protein [Erysipelotrichaceae bacterium]|nr:AIPR family protein [Erysipelotrichaceae bacterium]
MDRITEAFLKEFVALNDLQSKENSLQFEYFVNHCIVTKEYGNASFDLDDINTGKATQGIDGVSIIVNNKLVQSVEEISDLIELNNVLNVKFVLIQTKTGNKFDNGDILNFFHWTNTFFNGITDVFVTEEMKKFVELKEYIYSVDNCRYMSKCNPVLVMYYVTTGNWTGDNNLINVINANKVQLEETNLFSKIEFTPVGANQIQQLYRATKEKSHATFMLAKNVPLPAIPDIDSGYYGVIPFSEFKKIIIDDNGNIKNVFDDNIRDFLGSDNDVNDSMTKTLSDKESILNFGLLNNGVTIVSEELGQTGELFTMTNYQIVNGCQTSHILYQNREIEGIDNVCIPIKIIGTKKDDIKNQITTATNNQTAVKREQLEALSDFQRKLELYYGTYPDDGFKLYYERRTNQYSQLSIPKNRIVSIPIQIKAFSSMFMNNPHGVSGFYGTVVKRSEGKMFKSDDKLIMYYVSALAYYKIEALLKNGTLDKKYRRYKNHMLMLFRIKIAGAKMPQFNSADMEKYCNKLLDILNDAEKFLQNVNELIVLLDANASKLDLADRKLFERKETTDYLLSII